MLVCFEKQVLALFVLVSVQFKFFDLPSQLFIFDIIERPLVNRVPLIGE